MSALARACVHRSPWLTRSFPRQCRVSIIQSPRTRPLLSTTFRVSSSSASETPPTSPLSDVSTPPASHIPNPPPGALADANPPNAALLLFCLSTGLVDSLTFAISGVWCAFITGTTVQLGMDIPFLLNHFPTSSTELSAALTHFTTTASSERLAALSGFLLGGFVGPRFPRGITPARCSILQSALLASASALVLGLGPTVAGATAMPCPHLTLALISSSMALQAVLVQRFATPYATSVAWTSVWLGAVANGSTSRRAKKFVGIGMVMSGAVLGAAILTLGTEESAAAGVLTPGKEGNPDEAGSKQQLVRRVGWGLSVAAAIKSLAAVVFWRRARMSRVQI
ncbi:hypothetical protein POSPLADRAFT_1032698 [Postia placenta MAD-698-R-SB12]|uniref:Uncharacterized protein n=1 Tax=Postia placenta MAD-698-R-SB12 TaxID=670580 RepID=A0A1X6N740_9APHY|nr:hypothetical protein POSPLADRAFT_1032698 [Postia placenta MAD-698-R-SB12]OSX64302.1 hypothetical protein POSPLADRAFT_1032698 [Postia placenta MAD-698-R-SB12]